MALLYRVVLISAYVFRTLLVNAQAPKENEDQQEPGNKDGYRSFTKISVSLNSGVFTQDLPFDVPFVIESTQEIDVDRVLGFYREFSSTTPVDEPSESNHTGWTMLPIWEKGKVSSKYITVCPKLRHNKSYTFHFIKSKTEVPEPAELANLRTNTYGAVTRYLVGSCLSNQSCVYDSAHLAEFRNTLHGAVMAVFGQGAIIKSGSLFDLATLDSARVRFYLEELIDSVVHVESVSQSMDPAITTSNSHRADAAIGRMLTNDIQTIGEINRSGFPEVTSDIQHLVDLQSGRGAALAILENAIRGFVPLKTPIDTPLATINSVPFSFTFQPIWREKMKSSYRDSYRYIVRLREFSDGLIRDATRRRRLQNYRDARNTAERNSTDAANLSRLRTFQADLEVLERLFFDLRASASRFDEGAKILEKKVRSFTSEISKIAISEIRIILHGSTSGEFKTRANWYVSADVGVAYMFRNYGMSPYIGTNIYLRPINKQAELKGWDFKRRFSFLVALNLPVFGSDQNTEKLFTNTPAMLTGAGMRLSHALRFNAGCSWMKAADDDMNYSGIQWTPFISFSLDVNVGNVFNQILPASLKNTVQNSLK